MQIAFIGLGNMGGPMAANLAKAGHQVRGHDPQAPMPEGVVAAPSAAEAARGAEVVITMLPNGAILRAVAAEVIPARGCVIVRPSMSKARARWMHRHAQQGLRRWMPRCRAGSAARRPER